MVQLTPRQMRALELMTGGRSLEEIAYDLCMTRQTLKNEMTRVYRVLGVDTLTNPSWKAIALYVSGQIPTKDTSARS